MGQQRGLYRVVVELAGKLHRGAEVAPCAVLDLTEKGLRFRTGLSVTVNEELQLEFILTEERSIHCTIQITNVMPPYIGARIIGISPEHQKYLSHFIEQLIALNLTGF